jgi:hypothetical protein
VCAQLTLLFVRKVFLCMTNHWTVGRVCYTKGNVLRMQHTPICSSHNIVYLCRFLAQYLRRWHLLKWDSKRQRLKERDGLCTIFHWCLSEYYWLVWQTTGLLFMSIRPRVIFSFQKARVRFITTLPLSVSIQRLQLAPLLLTSTVM